MQKIIWFFVLFFIFVYINNTSLFLKRQEGKLFLLAHRGLAQTFPMEGITGETKTARLAVYGGNKPIAVLKQRIGPLFND